MIPYIINVALVISGCLVFYKLLLHKETFYKLNRLVLVLCLVVSFTLPLLQVPQQWSFRKTESVVEYNPGLLPIENKTIDTKISPSPRTATTEPPAAKSNFDLQQVGNWLVWLYWFGVIAFAINFLVQLSVLLYRAYTRPVIIDGKFRIVEVSGDKAPCSFGNNIFINPEKYDWDTYNQILMHEKLHVSQRHTIDILIAEIMLIFQWFNPFAWIYRKEIESNLEFLTDEQMVQHKEVERSSYQLSLLKVSTPHFPLSLTTNYNQSLLKKRIVMMNSKRSNLHTTWKYFFLLPLMILFACLLNEPVAYSQTTNNQANAKNKKNSDGQSTNINNDIQTEGYWFATIKDDKVSIQFRQDENNDNQSMNGSSFPLAALGTLPRGTAGNFKITREAGTMEFNGKFDGDQGMGRYKFVADKQYGSVMSKQVNETLTEKDLMVFFFIDIKKDYAKTLNNLGYTNIGKNDLIPLVALDVEPSFIRKIKSSGYPDVTLQNLVTLQALHIDEAYIKEIKSAGYSNISIDQLVSFKAQGIDKDYLVKIKAANSNKSKVNEGQKESAIENYKVEADNKNQNDNYKVQSDELTSDEIISYKALKIDDDYINSFRKLGYNNIPTNDLIGMKAVGVTPAFIQQFQAAGYNNIKTSDLITLKSLNITPEYINGFKAIGFKDIDVHQAIPLMSMKITPAYISSMREKGFNYSNIQKYITLKSIE